MFIDPNLQAFHTSTIGLLLPYDNSFDAFCIWASCRLQTLVAGAFYSHAIVGTSGYVSLDGAGEVTGQHAGADSLSSSALGYSPGDTQCDVGQMPYADAFNSGFASQAARDAAGVMTGIAGGGFMLSFNPPPTWGDCGPPEKRRVSANWMTQNLNLDSNFGKQRMAFAAKFPSLFADEGFTIDRPDCVREPYFQTKATK